MMCIILGKTKHDETILETNDCLYMTPKSLQMTDFDNDKLELLIFSWKFKENCRPLGDKTILYELLSLKLPHQYLMIHAGDKYLSPDENLNQLQFIEKIRKDHNFGTQLLPEWDTDSETTAIELFELLGMFSYKMSIVTTFGHNQN